MNTDEIRERTFSHMLDHGFSIQYIAGDKDRATRAYTVGRTLRNRPEFLVVGPFPLELASEILTRACALDDATPIELGDIRDGILLSHNCKAIEADPKAALMNGALAEFGEITALQLLWPDDEGRFPDNVRYAHPATSQPMYPKDDLATDSAVCDHCHEALHRENGWWVGADGTSDCPKSDTGHTVGGDPR